jgi:hypothetical protein
MHVPILGARYALLQTAGTRGSMKVGVLWQDEGGEFEGQQFLWLCARDGIGVEQRAAPAGPLDLGGVWALILPQLRVLSYECQRHGLVRDLRRFHAMTEPGDHDVSTLA